MNDLKIGDFQQLPFSGNEKIQNKDPAEFGKAIKKAIERVNGLEQEADRSVMDLLKGKADVHETMISLQKFDVSMRLLLTFRNKAIEAYKEIIHMQF